MAKTNAIAQAKSELDPQTQRALSDTAVRTVLKSYTDAQRDHAPEWLIELPNGELVPLKTAETPRGRGQAAKLRFTKK